MKILIISVFLFLTGKGDLFITAGSLKNLPGGLAGIECGRIPITFDGGQKILMNDKILTEKYGFELYPLLTPKNAATLASVNREKAAIVMDAGAGSIVVFASPFGLAGTAQVGKPVLQKVVKPLKHCT